MKITMTVCDRCGAKIVGGSWYVAINQRDQDTDDLIDGNPYEHKDFCQKCMQAIRDCIEVPISIAEPEPDPPEPVKEPEPEKKPVKVKQKKKPLDVSKVKALRTAGWTLEKIADEMGCCTQTVLNALKREDQKYEEEKE